MQKAGVPHKTEERSEDNYTYSDIYFYMRRSRIRRGRSDPGGRYIHAADSAAAFTVVNWKAGRKMEEIAGAFAWGGSAGAAGQIYGSGGDAGSGSALQLLADGEQEMAALDELYSTYLDSRSMLANQFELTRQILEKTRRRLSRRARTGVDCDEGAYRFHADIAASQCAALGGINGDCCGWQDIGDGQIAIVLSDGMGKGKKAASESLMVVRTVLSLLRSGVRADTALKTINSVMLMKDDGDSFATLDLVIADQRSGRAKFYKIGSCAYTAAKERPYRRDEAFSSASGHRQRPEGEIYGSHAETGRLDHYDVRRRQRRRH